jgi:hypothetical protein
LLRGWAIFSPSICFVAISKTVIPGEPKDLGRDPWFDRLTTLSKVEGESRTLFENQTILDPGSHPVLRDLAGMTNYNTASKREGHSGI